MLSGLVGLGTYYNVIVGIIRMVCLIIDSIVYSFAAICYQLAINMYSLEELIPTGGIVDRMQSTIYAFLAIVMFFRIAFSLLEMLVDPSKIDDKEKGASKIVTNIVICLVLIVAIPKIFEVAKDVQARVIEEHLIEKAIYGDDYKDNVSNNLGNKMALATWSVFLKPSRNSFVDDAMEGNTIEGLKLKFFAEGSAAETAWADVFSVESSSRTFTLKLLPLLLVLNERTLYVGGNYDLSYLIIISTVAGVYLAWVFIKLAIDIAYRALKLIVLEILSPIAVISYIDPKSSKDGLFAKWTKETVGTYLSLFVKIFVFALASILLMTYSENWENGKVTGQGLTVLIALIAFIKNAPKFIDKLFGTELQKGSESKFATDMLRGAFGSVGSAAIGGIGGAIVAKKSKMPVGKSVWEGVKKGATSGFTSARKGDFLGYGKSIYGGAVGDAGRSYFGQQSFADSKKQDDRLKWAKENAKRVASEAESHSFLKTNPSGEGEFRDKLIDTYKNGTKRQQKIAGEFLEHMGMAEKDSNGNLNIFDAVETTDANGNVIVDNKATSAADRARSVLKTDAQRAKVRALYGKAMASTEIFSDTSDVGKQMQDNAMHSFTAYREQAKSDLVASVAGDFGRQFDLSIKTGSLETLVSDFETQLNSSYMTPELKTDLERAISIASAKVSDTASPDEKAAAWNEKIQKLQPLISKIETNYTLISKNAAGQNQYYTGKAEDASKALGAMKKDPRTQADAMVLDLAKEGDPYLTTDEIKQEANNLNNRNGYNRRKNGNP